MTEYRKHLISTSASARQALQQLDSLTDNANRTLFVIDGNEQLEGIITDGDIRRGLLKDREITDNITLYMNRRYKSLPDGNPSMDDLAQFRRQNIFLIPFLNEQKQITRIVDLRNTYTVLPASALLMAGGKGERLRPLTENVPKPMLKVGDTPIIEHNINRLKKFGITDFYISVRYLSQQIIDYLGNGSNRDVSIKYIHEDEPLGTIGALGKAADIANDHILVMNSDILTNIDYEDFFRHYQQTNAKMCMASVPYQVKVPYGVLNTEDNHRVVSLREKPTYTYYSNAGIYLLPKGIRKHIPENSYFDATDLMEKLIAQKQEVIHYPLLNYWLDIGKYDDYLKAQQDIKHLNL